MSYVATFDTYVEINGVPMNTPAWDVTNTQVLLSGPGTRGKNVLIPGTDGTLPQRRRFTETIHTLEIYVYGDKGPDGYPNADGVEGLVDNIELLRSLVTDPGTETLDAYLHLGSRTLYAKVQVESFEVGDGVGPTAVAASMDITLPYGAFEEVAGS